MGANSRVNIWRRFCFGCKLCPRRFDTRVILNGELMRLFTTLLLVALSAQVQAGPFVANEVLTAAALNAALASPTITGGSISGVPISSATITGSTIDSSVIGASVPSTGAFTAISASGTVSGAGFTSFMAAPPAIGSTTPNAGNFTTFNATTSNTGTATATYPYNFTMTVAPTAATTQQSNGVTSSVIYNSAYNELSGGWLTPSTDYIQTQGIGTLDKVVGHLTRLVAGGGTITSALGYEAEIGGVGSSGIGQYAGFYVPNLTGVTGIGNVNEFVGFDMEDETAAYLTAAFLSNINSGSNKYGFYALGTAQNLFNGVVEAQAGILTTSLSASGTVSGTGFTSYLAAPPAIGSTTPNAGSFTTLSATGQIASTVPTGAAPFVVSSTTNVANLNASSLNGATFAAPGAIGSTTASSGAFTTLTASGPITPSQTAGIVGTTTNNNANAGSVGEVISATVTSGSAVTLTSGVTANVTSMSLTAGDWLCRGTAAYHSASTTQEENYTEGFSTTSATLGPLGTYTSHSSAPQTPGTAPGEMLNMPTVRELLATTTTVYMVVQTTFSVSTMSAYGTMSCTRTR